jgi:ADP-heptose:LPS heptosyltransferase
VEGFISHAAAAFAAPVLVVFSGYHDARTLAYANTVVISAEPLPSCAPCYLTACSQPRKYCTEDIPVQQVVQAVMQQLR